MFSETGISDGKVVWLKFWAHNDEESKQLEDLQKSVMEGKENREKEKA